jgi:ATP-dependent exoDNAse (exonuclease V) beta subunit
VYERPRTAPRGALSSVRPGLHRPEAGEHGVVFWDPGALDLDRADEVGLRQQRILAADEDGTVATEGERQHAEWHARRSAGLQRGAEPSFVVRTVTGSPGDSAAIAVTVERTDADRAARPRGKKFGVLLHAILAAADLGSEGVAVADLAAAVGRLVGSSAEEVAAAGMAAGAALRHPLLVRASDPSSNCRRECPISLRLSNGERIEGVLDLAFRDTSGKKPCWVVVDFKTDVDLEPRLDEYTAQDGLYARAVAEATGESVRAVLLSV